VATCAALNVVEHFSIQLLAKPGTGNTACRTSDQSTKQRTGQCANRYPDRACHSTDSRTGFGPAKRPHSACSTTGDNARGCSNVTT
jgi:hypothetical protein